MKHLSNEKSYSQIFKGKEKARSMDAIAGIQQQEVDCNMTI